MMSLAEVDDKSQVQLQLHGIVVQQPVVTLFVDLVSALMSGGGVARSFGLTRVAVGTAALLVVGRLVVERAFGSGGVGAAVAPFSVPGAPVMPSRTAMPAVKANDWSTAPLAMTGSPSCECMAYQ